MRIERTRNDPFPDENGGAATWVTTDSHWWDGSQIYGSEPKLSAAAEEARLRLDPDGQLPRDLDDKLDLTGVAGNFWLGLALLHAFHARAQRDRRPARVRAPGLDGRRAVRQGAPDHGGADGEDPYGRVDARDHRAPDDEVRHARELVRHPRQAARQAEQERGAGWHSRLCDGPPRRALLAHGGVRRGLPDARSCRRLHLSLARNGRGPYRERSASSA